MPHRYTDVDRLILKRWKEVLALREAMDDLQDRMQAVLGSAFERFAAIAKDRGYSTDSDPKRARIWLWKPEWARRSSSDPGVYLMITDCAPKEFGKVDEAHPSTWLQIEELARLKVKDREAFGRSVRAALPTEVLARWQADGVSLDESPLGKAHLDVTEDQRIEWMGAPAKLEVFLCSALDQCSEIVPAIDQAVQAAVPKQGES